MCVVILCLAFYTLQSSVCQSIKLLLFFLVLQILIPLFLSSNNFAYPSPSLLTSNFFCFSYRFTMHLFFFPLLVFFSFFCFLSVHTGTWYCGKILLLLENINNFPPTDLDIEKDFVPQFLHSLQCSRVLVHLPFLEWTVCQCHCVGVTFYSLSLSFVSSFP